MDLPSHPESDDTGTDHVPAGTISRITWLVVAVLAAVLAAMVILHLAGAVGPNAH